MLDLRLYTAQRLSALIMAPLIVIHIITMIIAVRGGLTTAEILSRTEGSYIWATFYGLFVLAVSVHAAIGLRVITHEWFGIRRGLDPLTSGLFLVLAMFGMRAVWAVTFGTGP